MTVRAYPYDTTDAAGSVTELEWRRLMQWITPSGVLRGEDNALAVTQRGAGANMSVEVATGQAFVVGHYLRNDAVASVAIGNNATGNPRIDTVVVGVDFVANTGSIYVVPGVVAAAPAPTALTQDITSLWEEALAYVYVAAGESVSITNAMIADCRHYAEPVAQVGLHSVRLATAAAMAASTITGLNRVANANGAMATVDGVAPAVGDVILDKDHATGSARGAWRIIDLGSATKPWRMRRSYFADTSAKVRAGMLLTVSEGTANGNTVWELTTDDPIVLGTTALTFVQLGASPLPAVGADFTLLRARAAATGGIEFASLGSGATVATSQSSTSVATYVDLSTPGPAVTLTTGTEVWVWVSSLLSSDHVYDMRVAVAVSGATTVAAPAGDGYLSRLTPAGQSHQNTRLVRITGLTPGSNTFTLKYMPTVVGGTGTFQFRSLVVIAV